VSSITSVENTSTITILATFTATGGAITWSLSGTDAANFSIDTSGQLRFAVSPDYETTADRSQSINVVATNSLGSDTLAVTVTVTNDTSDDLPEITSGPSSISRIEGTSTSTTIGTYSASGPTPITWSLTGTDSADFTINSSGQLKFASTPDYENPADSGGNNVYSFNVRATNSNGYDEQAVTVTVTNDTSDDIQPTVTTQPQSPTFSNLGSSTDHVLSQAGDSFTLTAGSASSDIYTSTTSNPKLFTMVVNEQVTVDVDVRGGAGGGAYGGAGGRVTGRMTLYPTQTYRLVVGAQGAAATTSAYAGGGFGGGGGGSAYTNPIYLSNIGGSRGYNTGQGSITITRV